MGQLENRNQGLSEASAEKSNLKGLKIGMKSAKLADAAEDHEFKRLRDCLLTKRQIKEKSRKT